MKVRNLLVTNLLIVALMAGFAFWVAGQVPAGTQLPTHWNAAGEVDDTMPALQALLLPAGIALLVGLIFAAIPWLEPMQDKLEGSAPLLRVTWIFVLGLMVVLQFFIAAPVFGLEPGPQWILALVGLLFICLGNMLPKSRPGFFVGVRTPWTITNTDNWIATHRLAGKLFLLAGLAMIIVALIDVPGTLRTAVVLAAAIFAALVPAAYSWWFWHTGRGKAGGGSAGDA